MKKKVGLILTFVLMLAVGFAVIVATQKPNNLEFVRWMENTYGIQYVKYGEKPYCI